MESTLRVHIPAKAIAEFFDCYFHIPLPIVTKHELGLTFSPRNLPIKFGTNPSTIYVVIVVTDRHTDRQTDTQTNASKNIFSRFRWDNKWHSFFTFPVTQANLPMWPSGQSTRATCAVELDVLRSRGSNLSPSTSAYQRIILNKVSP